jgi:hypothetical protein
MTGQSIYKKKTRESPCTIYGTERILSNVHFNLDKQLYMNFVQLLYNSLIQFYFILVISLSVTIFLKPQLNYNAIDF